MKFTEDTSRPARRFIKNQSKLILILLYIFFLIICAVYQFFQYYKETSYAELIARICGIIINYNSAIIILLVLRRLKTGLRSSIIGRKFIDVDDFLKFHKYIGIIIGVFTIFHVAGHSFNLYLESEDFIHMLGLNKALPKTNNMTSKILHKTKFSYMKKLQTRNSTININSALFTISGGGILGKITDKDTSSFIELLFTTKSGVGWFFASSMPTGWALLLILLIIEIFSLPVIRRKGYFQLFYYTHWLHVFFYIVLIIHAKSPWKWLIGSLIIVIIERLYSCFKAKSIGQTFIKDVNLLSSKVTQLIISRPKNFKFKAGDYIFIRIPEIARYEWHPFTISSAPELKDELWLHVRSLGNWTNKLYEYFSELSETKNQIYTIENGENIKEGWTAGIDNLGFDDKNERLNSVPDFRFNTLRSFNNINVKVSLDGAYSSSSRQIFDHEHVILISAGIGVTPFASILQSIWFNYMKSIQTCNNCGNHVHPELEIKKLKKVDFVWVNRDHKSFEWFIELLGKLELEQRSQINNRFLDMHLFMTSAKNENDIKLMGVPDTERPSNIFSRIDSLGLKLYPGRPNIDNLFANMVNGRAYKSNVFFCGNREFGKTIQKLCNRYNFNFFKEYF